jgi:hypothetical protein
MTLQKKKSFKSFLACFHFSHFFFVTRGENSHHREKYKKRRREKKNSDLSWGKKIQGRKKNFDKSRCH